MPCRNKEEALEKYGAVIQRGPCPECGKRQGKLCDTPFAWVCPLRLQQYDPQTYRLEMFL